MIKVETKKSLFLANINTMEEVVAQIEKRIKDAKKVVSKSSITDGDINQFIGTITPISKRVEELTSLQNTMLVIHEN